VLFSPVGEHEGLCFLHGSVFSGPAARVFFFWCLDDIVGFIVLLSSLSHDDPAGCFWFAPFMTAGSLSSHPPVPSPLDLRAVFRQVLGLF